MKKIEIINLVVNKKKLDEIKNILEKFDKGYGIKWCFPTCDELKNEFNILEKEIIGLIEYKKIICEELSQKCEHQVRLNYHGHHPEFNRCVLCDKVVYKNDNDDYGNYISFYSSIQDGEPCDEEFEVNIDGLHLINPYYDYHVIKIIEYVLKDKNDYDEIDLVSEIDKLDLPLKKIHNKVYYKK